MINSENINNNTINNMFNIDNNNQINDFNLDDLNNLILPNNEDEEINRDFFANFSTNHNRYLSNNGSLEINDSTLHTVFSINYFEETIFETNN